MVFPLKYHTNTTPEALLKVCVHILSFCFCFAFFYRHHAQAYLVKTVQSAFPITVKMNTNVTVFLVTQEDTVKQVRDMDKTVIYFLFLEETQKHHYLGLTDVVAQLLKYCGNNL